MPLFYPSHDIALGNGVKHFNPPSAALRLQIDLEGLSAIWQKENHTPIPWAWDYDTRTFLNKEYKIKLNDLPSDDDLSALRQLSSRQTTISIIKQLQKRSSSFDSVKIPVFIDNEAELADWIDNQHDYVLKTPWSSSGRGLSRDNIIPNDSLKRHGAATIRKMGGIIAEYWYEKVQDFAMLFYVGKNDIDFVGYSLFDNDESGTYRCGRLMSNQTIEASLPPVCKEIKQILVEIFRDMFAPFMHKVWEVGYIGVDMMIAEDNGEYFVHPCVEMNLRCTMGVVARMYYDKHCSNEQIGEYYITPASDYQKLQELDNNLCSIYHERYVKLTEINPETMFMAYAIFS